jgi:methyl coenzyme M reductase subunit C-like uncharacterized protein (methanogenesis marker protein 7)
VKKTGANQHAYAKCQKLMQNVPKDTNMESGRVASEKVSNERAPIESYENLPGFPPSSICPFKPMVCVGREIVYVSGSISFKREESGISRLPLLEQVMGIFKNTEVGFKKIDESLTLDHICEIKVICLPSASKEIVEEAIKKYTHNPKLVLTFVDSTNFPHPVDIQLAMKAEIPQSHSLDIQRFHLESDEEGLENQITDIFFKKIQKANLSKIANIHLTVSNLITYDTLNKKLDEIFVKNGFTSDIKNFTRSISYQDMTRPIIVDVDIIA